MNVRPARLEEREQLLALWERSVRASHHFLRESDVEELRPLVALELASDAVDWWVLASAESIPIGFLGYSPGTIEGLFLDPAVNEAREAIVPLETAALLAMHHGLRVSGFGEAATSRPRRK